MIEGKDLDLALGWPLAAASILGGVAVKLLDWVRLIRKDNRDENRVSEEARQSELARDAVNAATIDKQIHEAAGHIIADLRRQVEFVRGQEERCQAEIDKVRQQHQKDVAALTKRVRALETKVAK